MDEFEHEESLANEALRRRMDELRPKEYKGGDISWAQEIVDSLAARHLEDVEAQIRTAIELAESKVKGWDSGATRRVNALLRDINVSGQLPLDWMEFRALPLSIDDTKYRLGSVTPELLERWELAERRRAAGGSGTPCRPRHDGARRLGRWKHGVEADGGRSGRALSATSHRCRRRGRARLVRRAHSPSCTRRCVVPLAATWMRWLVDFDARNRACGDYCEEGDCGCRCHP